MTRAKAKQLRQLIERIAVTLDDETALAGVELFPMWAIGRYYAAGDRVQHGGRLWRCIQAHTSQEGWEPENVPALWEEICETHDGSLADPIPYDCNMALESGKYYVQDGVIYHCTRDTVNPVYHPLEELVGIYVDIA